MEVYETNFEVGDRINVSDSVEDIRVRRFLAALNGRVYYAIGDGGQSASTGAANVSRWEPPFPFEVGDRLRLRWEENSANERVVIHVGAEFFWVGVWSELFDRAVVNPVSLSAAVDFRLADTAGA